MNYAEAGFTPFNPDKRAYRRIHDAVPVPNHCHLCGSAVVAAHHDEVYGKVRGDWPWVYRCRGCYATVGMHPGTDIPLGYLADQATGQARQKAKRAFKHLYETGYMTRRGAYRWLAARMGLPVSNCHFGYFTKRQCERAETEVTLLGLKVGLWQPF